jgi:hypothetical protein
MNEWVHHDTPGCPVPPRTRVIVRFRDETREHAERLGSICADEIGWNASYRPIEYRLQAPPPAPGYSSASTSGDGE